MTLSVVLAAALWPAAPAAGADALPESCPNLPVVYIHDGDIYKNGVQVGSGVDQFTMREDGKLIWIDRSGRQHSA